MYQTIFFLSFYQSKPVITGYQTDPKLRSGPPSQYDSFARSIILCNNDAKYIKKMLCVRLVSLYLKSTLMSCYIVRIRLIILELL